MEGLLGVAGMIITSDYESFPKKSLLSTSQLEVGIKTYDASKGYLWLFGSMINLYHKHECLSVVFDPFFPSN